MEQKGAAIDFNTAFFNIQEVVPGLFIGPGRCARDLNLLQQNNITHVLVTNFDAQWFRYNGISYLGLDLEDSPEEDALSSFSIAFDFIDNALSRLPSAPSSSAPSSPPSSSVSTSFFSSSSPAPPLSVSSPPPTSPGGVLIHCTAGISRSSCLTISYLMRKMNKTAQEGYEIVQKARPWIRPNHAFEKQLLIYEHFLSQKGPLVLCRTTLPKPLFELAVPLPQLKKDSLPQTKEKQDEPMKKEDCELCSLEKRSNWYSPLKETKSTSENTSDFVVIECDSCDLPMAVWLNHTMSISISQEERMASALMEVADRVLGKGSYFIDKNQRTIFDHLHWHARPYGSWWAAVYATQSQNPSPSPTTIVPNSQPTKNSPSTSLKQSLSHFVTHLVEQFVSSLNLPPLLTSPKSPNEGGLWIGVLESESEIEDLINFYQTVKEVRIGTRDINQTWAVLFIEPPEKKHLIQVSVFHCQGPQLDLVPTEVSEKLRQTDALSLPIEHPLKQRSLL